MSILVQSVLGHIMMSARPQHGGGFAWSGRPMSTRGGLPARAPVLRPGAWLRLG